MSEKEMVLAIIREIPEKVTLNDVIEERQILAAIRRGEQAADAGEVITHNELKPPIASIIRPV